MNYKQQLKEILEDTVAYYGKNPSKRRSTVEGKGCRYLSPDGRMCAAARLLTPKGLELAHTLEGESANTVIIRKGARLKNKYAALKNQGDFARFLGVIQNLHDCEYHWGNSGLSEEGKEEVDCITEEIDQGQYD